MKIAEYLKRASVFGAARIRAATYDNEKTAGLAVFVFSKIETSEALHHFDFNVHS